MGKIIKNGRNYKGIQRFFDCETGKYFLEESQRVPTDIQIMAIFLYHKGLSFRFVGNLFGVAHTTVMAWFKKHKHLFDFSSTVDTKKVYDDVEIDELYTFCQKKA